MGLYRYAILSTLALFSLEDFPAMQLITISGYLPLFLILMRLCNNLDANRISGAALY
jgi:hypothetical protein